MNDLQSTESDVVVAGFGSPHGDDQIGWRVVAMLQHRPDVSVRTIVVSEGTQLLDELRHCRKLIVVDACRTGDKTGQISRLRWPDPRIGRRHRHSTHGESICGVLQLAERLGRLPREVQILGIEIGDCTPVSEMSNAVEQAMHEAESLIADELRTAVRA